MFPPETDIFKPVKINVHIKNRITFNEKRQYGITKIIIGNIFANGISHDKLTLYYSNTEDKQEHKCNRQKIIGSHNKMIVMNKFFKNTSSILAKVIIILLNF